MEAIVYLFNFDNKGLAQGDGSLVLLCCVLSLLLFPHSIPLPMLAQDNRPPVPQHTLRVISDYIQSRFSSELYDQAIGSTE